MTTPRASIRVRALVAAAALAALPSASSARHQAAPAQVQVTLDRGEAEAAVGLLETLAAGREPGESDWARLFATAGYRRLKEREAAMGRAFTDADFTAWLRQPETVAQAGVLRRTLAGWRADPSAGAAAKALAYLPPGTMLRATIFPMIKPRPNEFVFDLAGNPAIFLLVNPKVRPEKAANTLAHELHHIGLGAACPDPGPAPGDDPRVTALRGWLGAFGEGLAMLAAAGGPDVHPHAVSDPAERAEWDRNAARFAEELAEQDAWFRSVLAGTAGDEAAITARMRGYFGVQGPWYTVGWRMAVVIEKQLGRPRLIRAFCHPATLLATYNEAAARSREPLPRWDAELAARVERGN